MSTSTISTAERWKAFSNSSASGYISFEPKWIEPTRYATFSPDETFQKSAFFAGAGTGAAGRAAIGACADKGTARTRPVNSKESQRFFIAHAPSGTGPRQTSPSLLPCRYGYGRGLRRSGP